MVQPISMPDRVPNPPAVMPSSAGCWLHVVSHLDPKYGGLSAAVPELCGSLARVVRCGIELAAFCAPGEEHRSPRLNPAKVSFWPLRRGSWVHNHPLRHEFAHKIAEADALHVHGLWEQSTAMACRTARATEKPYVVSAHGMLESWALRHKRVKKAVYAALVERANVQGAACLHALTLAEAADYRRFGATQPIAVIPNGVAIPAARDAEPFLAAFPELRGKRLVLFLGRLHPKKGVDLLINAWAASIAKPSDAHLVLAGPVTAEMQATLSKLVAERGIASQVTFPGMLRDAMKWSALAAAQLFVLPSHSEGLSVSVLEALGMGLPALITAQCNMPEVAARELGWVIQPEAAQLTAALDAFWRCTPAEHGAMGRRGAALIAERYTWPSVAERMAEVYRWILGGPLPIRAEMVLGAQR